MTSAPVSVTAARVAGEPIAYADALRLHFAPVRIGDAWGSAWDTWWFHVVGEVPRAWAGRRVVLRLDLGWATHSPGFSAEAMVWRDGEPVQGICLQHDAYVVANEAQGGERLDLFVEAAANPVAFGVSVPWPVDVDGPPLGTLRLVELAVVDEKRDARRLLDVVGAEVHEALGGKVPEPAARRHRLAAVGNAHIDSAWLWPVRETVRKCARTFSSALQLLAEEPDYTFACSQPQQLAWMRDRYPGLYARIRAAVAEGRFELVGAMWVEPDTNVPSGESLVRQLVHGMRFVREEFGVDVEMLWLPDVFGYCGQLPQLMRLAGLRWFLTQKLSWNDTNKIPHHTFWWQGIDGSRVLAHFPPADTYNGAMTAGECAYAERNFRDHDVCSQSLYLYGHGDGGGGPTREMVQRAALLADIDGLPRVELTTAREFFETAEKESGGLATWSGELYFEKHRGTYTTQSGTKVAHRRAELALREAELWAAALLDAADYPHAELDAAWKSLLLQQFHDILPGSGIGWVYADALAALREVTATAEAITVSALNRLGPGDDLLVVNASPFPRTEVVDGDAGPLWAEAPALGWSARCSASLPARVAPVRASGGEMDNGLLRVRWDHHGLLTSVWDEASEREVLAGPGNLLQLHEDNPAQWDAWDIDASYLDSVTDLVDAESVDLVEVDPMRARLRVVRTFGASRVEQTITLAAGARRLDVRTVVDWHERHRLLKVAFPVTVQAPSARFEIQYGSVERPTHRNTSWAAAQFEVCAQRWADLSEDGYGVALLNDGRYGYDVLGNVLRLTLLRAPTWPDPEADQGRHETTYALLPHVGDVRVGRVVEQAYALNVPLRLARGASAERSLVTSNEPGVVVDWVKRADDGDGWVIRAYEPHGGQRTAKLTTTLPVSTWWRCDLHEQPIDTEPLGMGSGADVTLRPFEVLTLRLR